jgi:hypothetical protein
MENWKKQLNELMNDHHYFPFETWNHQLGLWCREWTDEIGKRSGIYATASLSVSEKKISVKLNGETAFLMYLKFSQEQETGMVGLMVRYTLEHHPLRKFKAIMKGEDVQEDETKDYSWLEESLTMLDGPILEKDFVLETITFALGKWMNKKNNR